MVLIRQEACSSSPRQVLTPNYEQSLEIAMLIVRKRGALAGKASLSGDRIRSIDTE